MYTGRGNIMHLSKQKLFLFLGIFNIVAMLVAVLFIATGVHNTHLFQIANLPYSVLLLLHLLVGGWLLYQYRTETGDINVLRMIFEGLFCYALLLFFCSYFYAENANMDYAQRFAATNGNLSLAIDSAQERLIVIFRYAPSLLILLGGYILLFLHLKNEEFIQRYALPLIFLGVLLRGLSMPSGLIQEGAGFLAWISLVPFFLVIRYTRYKQALFFAVVYGCFVVLFVHYWLGTFSFVSLQFSIFIRILYYIVFFIPGLYVIRSTRSTLILPLVWTVFEWYLHQGFASFPWGVLPHTQYQNLTLIQIASVTGIWGISFIIAWVNAVIAKLIVSPGPSIKMLLQTVLPVLVMFIVVFSYGFVSIMWEPPSQHLARVALIQNNSDPRKHSYERTLSTLQILTNQAAGANPDLIVWPETAVVPNISRWSKMPRDTNRYTEVVHDFLQYQKDLKQWLLTGNDDYKIIRDQAGKEIERQDYNAAVLFSDTGKRMETYHKIKLVPFTEYFPYKNIFPWIHNILLIFDVHLWEPGTEAVVFRSPKFQFSTLICFEDSFPSVSRAMVRAGAEVLVNMSNDYWAQNEVEAQQHYASAVFRAVEHRKPFIRATASGLTSYVDSYGRLQESTDMYEPNFLIADITNIPDQQATIYTRFGDWFIWICMGVLLIFMGLHFFKRFRP